eukprot:gene5283-5666_t
MITPLNPSDLLEAKEIKVESMNRYTIINLIQLDSPFNSSLLRRLHLIQCKFSESFQLPPNHLYEIIIDECSKIDNFINFHNIQNITLKELYSTSFKGLEIKGEGEGRNKEIKVIECRLITDFTPLKSFNKILIHQCRGFIDSRQIYNPSIHNDVSVGLHFNVVPMIVEGVSHLSISSSACFNQLGSLPPSVRVVTITFLPVSEIVKMIRYIHDHTINLEKIIITTKNKEINNEYKKYFDELFLLEYIRVDRIYHTVLLKKRH